MHTNNNKLLPPPPQVPEVLARTKGIYKNWIEIIQHIPKTSRYTFGNKVDENFLTFLETLNRVSYMKTEHKINGLTDLVVKLDTLRFLLLVGYESKIIDEKKYIFIATPLVEIGKMLGGWRKGLEQKLKTPQI